MKEAKVRRIENSGQQHEQISEVNVSHLIYSSDNAQPKQCGNRNREEQQHLRVLISYADT